MDVESAFPSDGEAAELVEQGEGLFDDVSEFAEALDPGGVGFGDDRFGAALAAGLAKRRTAVGLIGQQGGEAAPGTAWPARDGRVAVE